MCSAGGDVEYRSRSRGRGRSRSQRAGARSSPVNGSKQGTGPLARNGGWLQRQTLSSPETGGRLAHTVSDGATHSSCSVGRPTQGTGVPGRRRSEQSRPCSVQCAACSSGARRGCCSGSVLQPAARGKSSRRSHKHIDALSTRYRTQVPRYRGRRHSLFAHNGLPAPHGHPAVRRGRALCHCDHRPEAAAPRAAVRSRGASR